MIFSPILKAKAQFSVVLCSTFTFTKIEAIPHQGRLRHEEKQEHGTALRHQGNVNNNNETPSSSLRSISHRLIKNIDNDERANEYAAHSIDTSVLSNEATDATESDVGVLYSRPQVEEQGYGDEGEVVPSHSHDQGKDYYYDHDPKYEGMDNGRKLQGASFTGDTCPGDLTVVCVNGVTAAGETCAEACDGECCQGTKACDEFTGSVCKDGISCNSSSACAKANIGSVLRGCTADSSCFRAGYNGGSIGTIQDSCTAYYSCGNAGRNGGSIGTIQDSCTADYSCAGAGQDSNEESSFYNCCNTFGECTGATQASLPDTCDVPSVGVAPSESPSVSVAPSDSPSISVAPSDSPSISVAPSDSPSISVAPSDSPSISVAPSDSPSISVIPSDMPSQAPSESSQPNSISVPTATDSQVISDALQETKFASFAVSVEGEITITPQQEIVSCEENEDGLEDAVKEALQETYCANITGGCKVEILSIDCETAAGPRKLKSIRELGDAVATNLLVKFQIIVTAYCSDKLCSNGSNVANAIYESVTTTFKESIVDNTFVEALQAADSDNGIFSSGITTGDLKFSAVIAPLVAKLKDWYPDWNSNSNTCLNDGKAPRYMKKYIKSSLEACCDSYFSWDSKCVVDGGGSQADTYLTFYANYMEHACVQSCSKDDDLAVEANCGGLASYWLQTYKSAKECCEGKFFWLNQDLCIAKSTGTESEEYEGSGKWYVNVEWDACVQDCSVDNGDDCEGPPDWPGKALYDTKKQCCDTVLFWLSDECY